MKQEDQIIYLERKEIDISAWDRCIDKAANGLLYAYAAFLDAMAGDWHALVMGDYEAVMPLPFKKKWGLRYIYQPPFAAQLGIFGKEINAEVTQKFLKAIPAHFRLVELSLNHANLINEPGFEVKQRVNFILDLDKEYEVLYSKYRENTRRNIRKSNSYGCTVKKDFPVEEVVHITRQFDKGKTDPSAYSRFCAFYNQWKESGKAITYGISSRNGELIASAAFVFSHGRAYYLLVGNHPNGRTLGASHALIDAFIRDHAGQPLLLDFEGSDIRNLAFFYAGFGATEEYYNWIGINRLPWYAKVFKGN